MPPSRPTRRILHMQTHTPQAQGENNIGSIWACGNKRLSEITSRVWYYWSEKYVVVFSFEYRGPPNHRKVPISLEFWGHITSELRPPGPHISSDMGAPWAPIWGVLYHTDTSPFYKHHSHDSSVALAILLLKKKSKWSTIYYNSIIFCL